MYVAIIVQNILYLFLIISENNYVIFSQICTLSLAVVDIKNQIRVTLILKENLLLLRKGFL